MAIGINVSADLKTVITTRPHNPVNADPYIGIGFQDSGNQITIYLGLNTIDELIARLTAARQSITREGR